MFGQSKVIGVLYQYKTYSGFIWKNIGNKKVQPKYEGEITNRKPNGQGTQTWSDFGDKYVGEWKNGKHHGQGTFTWSDGSKYVGEYKDGEEWNGTVYDKNGNIVVKFVDGFRQY